MEYLGRKRFLVPRVGKPVGINYYWYAPEHMILAFDVWDVGGEEHEGGAEEVEQVTWSDDGPCHVHIYTAGDAQEFLRNSVVFFEV